MLLMPSTLPLNYRLHQYPVVRILICYILGIMVGTNIFLAPSTLLYCSLGATIALLLTHLALRTRGKRWILPTLLRLSVLTVAIAACAIEELQREALPNELAYIEGSIADYPSEKKYNIRTTIIADTIAARSAHYRGSYRLMASFAKDDTAALRLEPNDRITLRGTLAAPEGLSTKGEFDYGRYLRHHHYDGIVNVWSRCLRDSVVVAHRKERSSFLSLWRGALYDAYRSLGLTDEALATLTSLTIGVRSTLTEQQRNDYSSSGIAHLLAISGLHIGILYGVLSWISNRARHRIRPLVGDLLSVGVLWIFTFLVGAMPSAVRATTMCSLMLLARRLPYPSHALNTLSLTALIMLIADPYQLYDVGFQMSFAAVASIFVLLPVIKNIIAIPTRLGNYLSSLISLSIAAQIGVAPLLLYYFGQLPLLSVVPNLLLVPLLPVILILGWGYLPLSWIGWITPLFRWIFQTLFDLLHGIASLFASFPAGIIYADHFTLFDLLITYLLLSIMALTCHRPSRAKILWLCCSTVLFLAILLIERILILHTSLLATT